MAQDQINELQSNKKKHYADIFQKWAKRKEEEILRVEREKEEKEKAEKEKAEKEKAEKEKAEKEKAAATKPQTSAPSFTQKKKLNKADYMFKMLKD